MSRDLSAESFLKELGMRLGAAAIVVGIFVGLGYLNRSGLFGLDRLLESRLVFFGTAFCLVGIASVAWVLIQRHRA